MNQANAKVEILNLWKRYQGNLENGNNVDFYNCVTNFYHFLTDNYPNLLDFRSTEDKWQVVKGWIYVYEKYPNC